MTKKTIITKAIEVPIDIIMEVADLLIEHQLEHEITATDPENDTLTIEVSYEKEERDIIYEIEQLIDDYDEDETDEDDDDNDDNE